MILVTVGAQMPFDRLIQAVDAWAARVGQRDVFAQIGPAGWRPRHIEWTEFLTPADFRGRVERASLLVAHAGMGSILTALELGRPILVMPRRGDLGETRNDHQVATARQFAEQGRVAVAMDELELATRLDEACPLAAGRISRYASPMLIQAIREFVGLPAAEAPVPVVVTRPQVLAQVKNRESIRNAEATHR